MARKQDLERWRDAGLIDEATAVAIEKFEQDEGEIPRWLEAIAYVGATLLFAGILSVVVRIWDDMSTGTVVVLAVIGTVVSLAAGWMFGRADSGAARRAQAVTWFLGTVGFAIALGLFFADLTDLESASAYTVVAVSSLAVAATLWHLRRSSLQMVAMAIGAGAAVVAPLTFWEDVPEWPFGVTLTGLGVGWIIGTYRGVLHPSRTSYAMGAIGVLLIGFPDAIGAPQLAAGTLACLGLIGTGVKLNENTLLGHGVVGLLWYPPALASEVFGEGIGFAAALVAVGAILLLIVTTQFRARKQSDPA